MDIELYEKAIPVTQQDIVFRFPDGHTWAYAGYEQVWMHEAPIGAEWTDCQDCDNRMEEIGEPPPDEVPFEVVTVSDL